MENAQVYAQMMSGPLGNLPSVMRGTLDHVVIHKGDETAFGESDGHFFVLYSENMKKRVSNHDLEETVFHESVHATLESKYSRNREWLSAQETDNCYITEYAADNPTLEDLPESALFAYVMFKHPGRLPSDVEKWAQKHMQHRLALFRKLFSETDTGKLGAKAEDNR